MSYKIAVASSDGKQVDESFGSAKSFIIYEVTDGKYSVLEERFCEQEAGCNNPAAGCGSGAGGGCGEGGCGGAGDGSVKVESVSDCRCIVCRKIGFRIQKQLERKAIAAFDVSVSVEEALAKITNYFGCIDNHESLRGQRGRQ